TVNSAAPCCWSPMTRGCRSNATVRSPWWTATSKATRATTPGRREVAIEPPAPARGQPLARPCRAPAAAGAVAGHLPAGRRTRTHAAREPVVPAGGRHLRRLLRTGLAGDAGHRAGLHRGHLAD